jgi:hypothetical protein
MSKEEFRLVVAGNRGGVVFARWSGFIVRGKG